MPRTDVSVSPHIRALVRTLLLVITVSWTLSATANHKAAASPCGDETDARAARWPYRPSYCDHLTRIGVGFLNDQTLYPEPNGPAVGEIHANRVAACKVYAHIDDPRFCVDITHEIKYLQVQARSPKGSAPVKGKFIYSRSSNAPIICFIPVDDAADDRVVFLDISYHCRLPKRVFRTQFLLTIRGERGAVHSEELEAGSLREVEPEPAFQRDPGDGLCSDLAVSVTGPAEPIRQGDPFSAVVTVQNVGATVSTQSEIMLPAIRVASLSLSQGSVGIDSWRDRRLRHFPGRLEPGAEAVLAVAGRT